jgi:hypothetical protein
MINSLENDMHYLNSNVLPSFLPCSSIISQVSTMHAMLPSDQFLHLKAALQIKIDDQTSADQRLKTSPVHDRKGKKNYYKPRKLELFEQVHCWVQ